jgi:hypothetical protein
VGLTGAHKAFRGCTLRWAVCAVLVVGSGFGLEFPFLWRFITYEAFLTPSAHQKQLEALVQNVLHQFWFGENVFFQVSRQFV